MSKTHSHARHPSGELAPIVHPARMRSNGDGTSEGNKLAMAIDALIQARIGALNTGQPPEVAHEALARLVERLES